VYLYGPVGVDVWGWERALLQTVTPPTINIRASKTLSFTGVPHVSFEEALSIYRDIPNRSIRTAAANDLSNPSSPSWGPANELVTNVMSLAFNYFDDQGNAVAPTTLAARNAVHKIGIDLIVESAAPLSDGSVRTLPIHFVVAPRNLRKR
jgi:hypothetical protein